MKFKLLFLSLCITFFFLGNEVFSQVSLNSKDYYLTLNKPGRKKRIRFYIGEELKFKLKDENFRRTATITAIDSNSITINGVAKIPLEDFKMIHVEKDSYFAGLSRAAHASGTGAGIVFGVLGGVATLLNVEKGETMIYGGGVLFVVGQFFNLFTSRNYRLNSYRYLRTVPQWQGLDLEKTSSY